MLVEYINDNYYARFHDPRYHSYRGRDSTNFTRREILTKSMKHEMQVKGTWSWCVLVEYVKDNNYPRFHDPSYHRYRERHFRILVNVKF